MQKIGRGVGFHEGPAEPPRVRVEQRHNDSPPTTVEEPETSSPVLTDPRPRSIGDRQHTAILVCTDLIASCAALPVALILLATISVVPTNSMNQFGSNLLHDALFPAGVVVTLAVTGSYRSSRRALGPSAFKEIQDMLLALGGGCVLTIAVGAFLHATTQMDEPLATQLICAVLVGVIFVIIGRSLVRHLLRSLTVSRVLVVGSGPLVDRIATYLGLDRGAALVGRVVDSDDPEPGSLGTVQDLPRLCDELAIQRIIVAYPDRMALDSVATYRTLQDAIHIAFVPRYFELVSWRSHLTDLSGLPLIEVAKPDMSGWDRFLKRSFDVVVSFVCLILLSPLLAAVALAVRLTSSGPALFRQTRLGRGHQPFTILKFRTMQSLEAGRNGPSTNGHAPQSDYLQAPLFDIRKKLEESDRITRVGGFLRKTGLDELPQLLNVLAGHMSIVGPRPFIPLESDLDGWAARRFEVRPGITGLWQVSGRNQLSLDDLRQLDYLYVASWSFWWDLKIVFDTPRTMARGIGAY
jgi:exopolysaccharide biosynthesis polyprenyl glycosylphosphotransferase